MPKISVIMGVYNSKDKELLRKSIESIMKQTYEDWELLVYNDGSTDDTLDSLYSLANDDSRIKILSNKNNKGLSHALNQCIEHAKGTYIARQDDDDISDENRFIEELTFLDTHKDIDYVCTCADVYDKDGVWGKFMVPETITNETFLWNSPFIHPTLLIRTDVIRGIKGYSEKAYALRCEDYELFMRLYANGYKGYNIQKRLYKYYADRNPAKKYRPMKVRINEMKVRYMGFKELGLLPKKIIYVIKPVIIGIIPQRILTNMKRRRNRI